MSQLKVDVDQLLALRSRLDQIEKTLRNDVSFSVAMSEHVGHDELASRLREFATGWNIHREGIVEKLEVISRWVGSVGETFQDVERQLSDSFAQPETGNSSGAESARSTP